MKGRVCGWKGRDECVDYVIFVCDMSRLFVYDGCCDNTHTQRNGTGVRASVSAVSFLPHPTLRDDVPAAVLSTKIFY
jgi:hypothetical protein